MPEPTSQELLLLAVFEAAEQGEHDVAEVLASLADDPGAMDAILAGEDDAELHRDF